METLESLEAADDSSENSAIVKSEDGSPNHDNGRGSPPPNCAICLGRCRNKSFTDSCLHQFCFNCLLKWSRVKTECPLCKQNFKSIIHNVKSNHQYEEYRVQQPQSEPNLDFSDIFSAARRFRYRTTLTLPRRETMAIRQFLMHYPLSALMHELPARSRERTGRSPADFRRTVYRHNMWARPLPDFTGRFRDCSPEFFRYNDSQVHRLVPWLSRELFYLLNENSAHVSYVLGRVLELVPRHPILSEGFRAEMRSYLGDRTDHFLHEFQCFASTPYDLTGYDRHVQYRTEPHGAGASIPLVSEVLSSSDSDSRDSDIVVVSSSQAAPGPGPSRADPAPAPAYPQPAVVPIETISHSDSDSDSEVMVVGYIKPPHQRTPELVDLIASDSDVLVQEPDEGPPAAPAAAPAPVEAAGAGEPLVKFKLSMACAGPSSGKRRARPHPRAPRRRRRARPAAPAPGAHSSTDEEYYSADATYGSSSTSSASSSSSSGSSSSSSSSSSASSSSHKELATTPKLKKKYIRNGRGRERTDRPDSRRSENIKKPDGDKTIKGKSRNGKDVKCSKVEQSKETVAPETASMPNDSAGPNGFGDTSRRKRNSEPALDEAGPSRVDDGAKKRSAAAAERPDSPDSKRRSGECAPGAAGPSGLVDTARRRKSSAPSVEQPGSSGLGPGVKRKRSTELSPREPAARRRSSRRTKRDNKRLKSVVKVMKRDSSASSESSEHTVACSTIRPKSKVSPVRTTPRPRVARASTSDDDIPLRFTLNKPYSLSRTHVSDYSD